MWFLFKPQLTYSVEDTVIITHLRINFKDNCNFQLTSQKPEAFWKQNYFTTDRQITEQEEVKKSQQNGQILPYAKSICCPLSQN